MLFLLKLENIIHFLTRTEGSKGDPAIVKAIPGPPGLQGPEGRQGLQGRRGKNYSNSAKFQHISHSASK